MRRRDQLITILPAMPAAIGEAERRPVTVRMLSRGRLMLLLFAVAAALAYVFGRPGP